MTSDVLTMLIERGLTERQIGSQVGLSQTTVRYWLKRHGLTTKTNKFNQKEYRCKTCDETRPDKFKTAGKDRVCKTVCSACHNKQMCDVYRELKRKGVEYKGGRCVRCG